MSTATVQGTLITPDFGSVQDTVGEGIYKVRIIDGKLGEWAGRDGKPPTKFINWRMETFGESEDKNNGRSVFHRTPIEGGGAFRIKDLYRAAIGEELAGAFDFTMLYGREVEITVGPQKDKPEYMEVKAVRTINH
jgi:hypothetical protein